MGTETLLLALLVFLTVIAYMIAINAHGVWRLTLSFLLATCMLGGTVWVIILQYSTTAKASVQIERRRLEAERLELMQDREQTLAEKEQMSNSARVSHLITLAGNFAASLQNERLQDPAYEHGQLVERAVNAKTRLTALQNEINSYKYTLGQYPEAAKLLENAMTDLAEACRLYHKYYFSENSAAEQSAERQMRQKVKNAQAALADAVNVLENKNK
jgi:hypothetical protein